MRSQLAAFAAAVSIRRYVSFRMPRALSSNIFNNYGNFDCISYYIYYLKFFNLIFWQAL